MNICFQRQGGMWCHHDRRGFIFKEIGLTQRISWKEISFVQAEMLTEERSQGHQNTGIHLPGGLGISLGFSQLVLGWHTDDSWTDRRHNFILLTSKENKRAKNVTRQWERGQRGSDGEKRKRGEQRKGNRRRPRLTNEFAQRIMIHKHTQTLSNSTQPTGVRVISQQ